MRTHIQTHNQDRPTVLVDMDGVMVDYEGELEKRWNDQHPDKPLTPRHLRTHHRLDANFPDYKEQMWEINSAVDFFYTLEPMPYAQEGIKALKQHADVIVCTKPSMHNPTCISGKLYSLQKHFGEDIRMTAIVTKDKTVAIGNYLIDDMPEQPGKFPPSWEHVLYDHPYNANVNKRRMTWEKLLEYDGDLEAMLASSDHASYYGSSLLRTGT